MFNGIDEDFDNVAIRTFKVSLPAKYDLRKSLTRKSIRSVRRLMDRINEYKQVERTSSRERGRLRWSRRTEGISGRTGTITIDLGEILRGILDLLLLR